MAAFIALAGAANAQTLASLTDIGTVAPTPGASDVSQLSTTGNQTGPDGLNYFTDNQTDHNAGEPGQTFTTGASTQGYLLSTVSIKTAGLGSYNSIGTAKSYLLHIYTVSGTNVTLLTNFISQAFSFNDGDWLQWSGFSIKLASNSVYAYSFGKAVAGGGWEAMAVASNTPYSGGQIGLFPPAGGGITFGGSHNFDAVFNIGLSGPTPPVTTTPAVAPTNNPFYSGTAVTLTENATGTPPLAYQWRTDGGLGGARTNIPGANSATLNVNTTGLAAGAYHYDVVVTNTLGSSTSAIATLNLTNGPPVLVRDISPNSKIAYIGDTATFAASFAGTLPISYQWQANTGAGATNIPGATNSSLTLSNVQSFNAGAYHLLASNSQGGPVSSSVATLQVLAMPTFVNSTFSDGPFAYWRLNETASTASGTLAAVDSANGINGVYGSSSTDGIPGPSASLGFPGFENSNSGAEFTNGVANSLITLPALNLNTNTVTITAWVYPIGTPAYYAGIVLCRNGGDASGFNFTENGQLGYTWNQNNSDTWSWMSGLVPPPGQWSFVALATSPSNAVAYLCNTNGTFAATNSVASTAEAFSSSTLIGSDGTDGGRTFNGVMDEVAIFNYTLTQPQILNLYFSAASVTPAIIGPTASPSNTVYAGVAVNLNVSAFGPAPFQYQWQFNGTNLPGATNTTLTIADAQGTNSGNYAVLVANSFGTNESSTLVLTVNPASAPIFTQEPTPPSATNYVNGLATFTSVVNGSPPIALQWTFNGTNLPGQTAASLTLPNLQTNESGTYTLRASNSLGVNVSTPVTLTVLPQPNPSALNVLTYHNDNTRQGANTNEVLLTPANVNVSTFGRIITYPVDGYIYAQPLYVADLLIPGHGTHNVVFVATEHNSIYAFDGDGVTGTNGGLLWHTNLGMSALSSNHEFGDRYNGGNYTDIVPEVGVTGTPVINLATGTLYVDVRTRVVGISTNYYHSIHALNITNGTEQSHSPVTVSASVPGGGVDTSNGVVTFNALQENQRPGMTLVGGMLYVAYGSFADTDPYHGWVIGFNATNLGQSSNYVFNTTPNATVAAFGGNAGEGALWMGGNGLAVDANSNLYFLTANGSFSANTNGGDYSDSFVRLSTTNGLIVGDYFTPYNQASLAASDADLGSGGMLLLPDSAGSAAHPHLLVGAGKEGKIYLVDRDNMGHYNSANDSQIVQELQGAIGSAFSSPAYFDNQIYYQGSGDVTKGFIITNGVIVSTPASQATTSFSALGGTPSISANGTNNGIVWTIQSDAFASSGPAILHAYNATNLAIELYNSSRNLARDNPGGAIQMTTPTVVNGKVYVGTQYALSIFGNSVFVASPVIAPGGGLYTNSVIVTLSDATPGASIYYTLDGTTPTTNSLLYAGPFQLTYSAGVQAFAFEPGATPSAVTQASFINSASIGSGAGLTGSYYSNHTAASPFTGLPTLVRTDPTVNFIWNASGPTPNVGKSNYTVRWTGCVQPQFSENYTFYTTTDDGVRLWVNGQEIINAWVNQSPTVYQASLPLVAQQLYNVEMDFYYQNDGGAEAELAWSSPSTPQTIIPQTQLYPYTNPPPTVVLSDPTNGSTFTAAASVSLTALADAPYNPISHVNFYTNGSLVGSVSNAPYSLTVTGLAPGSYTLTATATDGSGLTGTSAPVAITVRTGSGLPYGLTNLSAAPPFYNMPGSFTLGAIPTLLSQTGVFSNTPAMLSSSGLLPYSPNTPLWSDNALKIRYLSVPNNGGENTPGQQIGFSPTGSWTFPSGAVFVKTFELQTNLSDPNSIRRLETRLLVRDTNGAVYGVTYKWLPDNSDAVLLSNSLTEPILITNSGSSFTQNWYYPSPADCLTCHTPVSGYVLGVNTRQLNGSMAYASTGVTDNQLRTLNRLGLFYPAFDETNIVGFEQLSSITNQSASLVQRARSYLDANCAQCHQPGGAGITFDARYDTPLTNQHIINAVAAFSLGYDNAKIVSPSDIWRSVLYDRMNTLDPAIKMPPLDRMTIDTNAVQTMVAWINSLGGTPALAPPIISPASGIFTNRVTLALQPPDTNAALYYTLDGSLPTTNSTPYTGPFTLDFSAVVNANAFETNHVNSVAASGSFTIVPPLYSLFDVGFGANGSFQMQYWAPTNQTYVLETSTDLTNWTPLSTNVPVTAPFILVDPSATNANHRYYRVVTQ